MSIASPADAGLAERLPSGRIVAAFVGVDLVFTLLVGWGFLALVGAGGPERAVPVASFATHAGAATSIFAGVVALLLAPIRAWHRGGDAARAAASQRTLRVAHALPLRIAFAWAAKWTLLAGVLLLRHGAASGWGAGFFVVTMFVGPWPLAHSLATWLLAPTVRAIWTHARHGGVPSDVAPRRIGVPLAVWSACLAVAPCTYVASLSFSALARDLGADDLLGVMLVDLSAVLVYAVLCAMLLSATMAGPIRRMTTLLASITRKGEAVHVDRVPVERCDEIGRLAEMTNEMIDRLEGTDVERSAYRSSLEQLNASLEQQISARTRALEESMHELRRTQRELLTAARRAGMADVATSVLHNVGNALNSVLVSVGIVRAAGRTKALAGLGRGIELLCTQAAPGRFLDEDPRGPKLLEFLRLSVRAMQSERLQVGEELERLTRNVDHVAVIVGRQQKLAGRQSVTELRAMAELVEQALEMEGDAHRHHRIEVVREIESQGPVDVDAHSVLQILLNLLANARDAVKHREAGRRIVVRSRCDGDESVIEVEDNGCGIPAENLQRIFGHGFTTKPDGHGFGLHGSACTAGELGGRLTARSPGVGQGATFTLVLPIRHRSAA